MFTLKIENRYGEFLDFSNNPAYDILSIEGLSPPAAALNFSTMANFDGSRYNSGRLDNRNLVLTIKIHNPAEKNRVNLYKYFQMNRKIRLHYANNARAVFIDGYVETFENNLFTMNQTAQISIICPNPYWQAATLSEITFSQVIDQFKFPFSIAAEGMPFSTLETLNTQIIENGEIETGVIIEFRANTSQILNPKLINRTTNQFFGVNFDLNEGDVIRINTNRGEKSVVLIRDGIETNIINSMATGSSWLQLAAGINEISYECDEGAENLTVYVSTRQYFEGV